MADLPQNPTSGPESFTSPQGDPLAGKTSKAGKGKAKAEATAETVREKGHGLADSAKHGVDRLTDTAETATDYAERAKRIVSQLESKLDTYIDLAEKWLDRGARYASTAKSYMNEHPEYRERAEKAFSKASELKGRLSAKKETAGGTAKASTKSKIAQMREKGRHLVEEGQERYEEARHGGAAENLKQSARDNARQATSYVRTHPVDTLLVGAAVGVIFGTVIKNLMTNEPDYALPPGPGPDTLTSEETLYGEPGYVAPDDIQ